MPNWCHNELHFGIAADRDVATIMQQIKERCAGTREDGKQVALTFSRIVPPPDDPAYRDIPDQKTAKKSPLWWYDWNVKNWGTKWDCADSLWGATESEDMLTFNTAWSPPFPIAQELSKLFEDVVVHLRFEEGGMDFAGDYIYVNGHLHFSNDREYDEFYCPHDEGIIEHLLSELSNKDHAQFWKGVDPDTVEEGDDIGSL